MLFPLGHFYSPMYEVSDIVARRDTIWPDTPRPTLGIDWREAQQLALCEVFASQPALEFRSQESDDPTEYWSGNDQYPPLDAWVLAALLRHYRPAAMIEIGCGFSSLVSARINREERAGRMRFTCIEPYPRQFLRDGVDGISELRVELIQDVPPSVFEQLDENDVLFVDTSHTVKTGGDVTWIFNEIVPRLRKGVVVHVHDIFLPGEYPEIWVMEGRGWNESYLLQSFLSYNDTFEVVFGTQFMLQRHPEALRRAFPAALLSPHAGGSLWFRRTR